MDLQFDRDGAQRHEGLLDALSLERLHAQIAALPADRPGVRIGANRLSGLEAVTAIAAKAIGADARAVRAVLFDKTASANWNLGWHQDRTIVVKERIEAPGFGPWSVKDGLLHVEPPFAVIEAMTTARIHLDPVDADNAPLRIAPGSHRLGRVPSGEIEGEVARLGVAKCLAQAGDVWLYATPIFHASAPAARPRRRRVLQIDFSAEDLPRGLEWLGL
jgi:ectoine hydroxylase-related dioxygenase (phytanoyl-CoA dioxygenase family)